MRRDDIPTAQRRRYEDAAEESGVAEQQTNATQAFVDASCLQAEDDLAREAVFQRPEAPS